MENKKATQRPQRQRILDALEKLREISECWDEEKVGTYPPDLPSFDEFVADLSGKLLAIDWRSLTHCRTCGSEVVETINDSLFRDGECGGCEEGRYTSHAAPLAAACTDRTFRAACVLTHKFGLNFAEAWPIFLEWNETCEPPWSERELQHKLSDAIKKRH